MDRNSYERLLSKLILKGRAREAHDLARQVVSANIKFRNPANTALFDRYILANLFEIKDPEIQTLFDPRWIRTVNISQVLNEPLAPFHEELRNALVNLGFVRDASGNGNIGNAERLVLPEPVRAKKVSVIEQLKSVVAHIVRKYLAQCSDSGYPTEYLSDRFALNYFAHATRNGGHHTPHTHNNAMFVVAYYVDVPPDSETEIVFGGHARPGLPEMTMSPITTKRPVTGDFIVFPGFLPHTTTPQFSPEMRINMAFDVQPA